MEENAASEVQGQQKSSGDNGKASEVKPNFFVTAAGTESLPLGSPDFDGSPEVEPLSPAEEFNRTPTGLEKEERRPEKKKKADTGDQDKARQQFDQHAANLRKENEDLRSKMEEQGKQLTEVMETLKKGKTEPEEAPAKFSPLTPDSDVEEMVERLNELGSSGTTGSLAEEFGELKKAFESDRSERREQDKLAARQSYLSEMRQFLKKGAETYGDKYLSQVEQQVGSEMANRGYGEKRLPDLYTLELAIKNAFNEVSGGRKRRRSSPSSSPNVALDTGTGGAPTTENDVLQPKKLSDWIADKKTEIGASR